MRPSADPVLLLCAHGSRARSAQVATQEIAQAVSQALPSAEVVLTWVDVQEPNVEARCEEFADRPVVIVPLLLAAGFHVYKDLAETVADRPHHVVTDALGPDRLLSELMARRIMETELGETGVAETDPDPHLVMVAAGSSDARAVRAVRQQAADLEELTGRPVTTGFVSAAHPKAHQAVAEAWHNGAHHVTTVSFHVAPGVFHRDAAAAAQTPAPGAPSEHAATGGRVTEPLLIDGAEVPAEVVDVVVKRWEQGRALLGA
ncbi:MULTISPECIES: sirohydrochlorin chelatase [Kocuria]|uniref:Cobalamin biosynthesis protein CbiX n=1 Tax=Kocuria subflava TaxID=1736139 RepID=A0A846TR48_9MICC|nr:CbiX/SirB N-terminal domain-containing protein [Kocuria sp. CPCC 104605]NKE09400.1 cobalamin biosynthesis protein CbiX [Kocuria subflava]